MPQTGSQDLGWPERWGVVRLVREKLEFAAFFDTREDAEAAEAAPHRRPSGSPKSKPISARNWKFESITLQHGVCCELAFRRAYH